MKHWCIIREVRTAVDLCHRDGSLKTEVASDPGKYIHEASKFIIVFPMDSHIHCRVDQAPEICIGFWGASFLR